MNTQSHAVLNLYIVRRLLARRLEAIDRLTPFIVTGAVLPDVPIMLFFFWYTWMVPTPQRVIWGTLYFSPGWQTVFDLFHSLPLFSLLALLAYLRSQDRVLAFSLAALLHFLEDFFLHQQDGHAHFFPLSDYKFISPVSYWDPRYFGHYASLLELGLTVTLSTLLFPHLKTWWGKSILVLANLSLLLNDHLWFWIFATFR